MLGSMDTGEAERLVRRLAPVPLLELGMETWLEQHKRWERLNCQSHLSASSNSDDFVLASLITFDALPLAVRGALTVELWKENVLPTVLGDIIADKGMGPMRAYYILHHEAILVNLLENVLYHDYAAESLGDCLLDLVDYCVRQVNTLIITTHARKSLQGTAAARAREKLGGSTADPNDHSYLRSVLLGRGFGDDSQSAADRIAEAPLETLLSQCRAVSFNIGCSCVAILRFLTDYLPKLSLSVQSRLLDHHDIALLCVPLLENPPWVRKVSRAAAAPAAGASAATAAPAAAAGKVVVWQKFVQRQWVDVPAPELLRLTALEGQPWLALYNLLLEPAFRGRYEATAARKGTLSRVRRFLNETLVDQLPMLAQLQRCLDEMSLLPASSGPASASAGGARGGGALLLEVMPLVADAVQREAMRTAGGGWPAVSRVIARHLFRQGAARAAQAGGGGGTARPSAGSSSSSLGSEAEGALSLPPPADLASLARMYTDDGFFEDYAAALSPGGGAAAAAAAAASVSSTTAQLATTIAAAPPPRAPLVEEVSDAPQAGLCARPGCDGVGSKRCGRCARAWYCGRECQVAHWAAHKPACALATAAASTT